MLAEVKILVEGFTNANSFSKTGEERTQATVTLVRDGDITIVVDPGVLESQQVLIDALAREELSIEDIDFVCITHSHIDHYRNIGMFPGAKVLEYYGIWDKNKVTDWVENFSDNIQLLHTPGHDDTDITIFVNTKDGTVAICGDVFWDKNYPKEAHEDGYASNPAKLAISRKIVLEKADWIIPGHGGIYKNENITGTNNKNQKKEEHVNIYGVCKKCGRIMKTKYDSCRCRPHLCYYCCECPLDCDLCSCSHRRRATD